MDPQTNQSQTIGYVMSVWPRLSETFILQEIIAVERLGGRLRIFSVKNPKDGPVHAKVAEVRAPVKYLSIRRNRRAVWKANLRLLFRQPVRYLRTLFWAMRFGRPVYVRRFFQAGYLAEIVSKEGVSHLHAHFAHDPTLVAMFTHRLMGIPYSFTAHAKDIYVKTPLEILRAEAKQAQAVITCTDYNKKYLMDHLALGSNDKLHCIYHGLDVSQFKFSRPNGPRPGPPVILSVARLVEKKGLNNLIAAADILRGRDRSFHVEIIGDGPMRPALEEQVTRLGLNNWVKLAGPLPHESVCEAYGRACLFVLPCVVAADGDRDGIPNVLLEAMACGVPVVATPVSGIPELIDAGREGVLVPPNSPEVLADALDNLLAQPELCDCLARAARAKVEAWFSVEGSSSRLFALFQRNGR